MPKKGTTIGTAGFVFFFVVAIANLIFGALVFTDNYQPLTDSGDVNLILQGLIGINILMFLVQGLYEIVISKRFVVEKAFN